MNRGRGIKTNRNCCPRVPVHSMGRFTPPMKPPLIQQSPLSLIRSIRIALHFSSGDVVFTLTGENKVDIAKTVAFLGDGQIAAGGDLAFWTHHGMNPLYLVWLYMASPYCIELKRRTATGDIIVTFRHQRSAISLFPFLQLKSRTELYQRLNSFLLWLLLCKVLIMRSWTMWRVSTMNRPLKYLKTGAGSGLEQLS